MINLGQVMHRRARLFAPGPGVSFGRGFRGNGGRARISGYPLL